MRIQRSSCVVLLVLATIGCAGLAPGDEPSVSPDASDTTDTSSELSPNCIATDRATLMSCYQRLLAHTATRLTITEPIRCVGPEACHLLFEDVTGPITIVGRSANGGPVSITRTSSYDYPVIDIRRSSRIIVRNIDFMEGQRNHPHNHFGTDGYDQNDACDQPPRLGSYLRACRPTISIVDESADVMVDRVSVVESKGFPGAIELGNVTDVTIRRSEIVHSWSTGIYSTQGELRVGDHVPYNLKIESNTFRDNRCSGIEIAAHPGVVSGNYFDHNHNGAIYHVQGGQLNPMKNSDTIVIADNEVANGAIDEDPWLVALGWHTPGIETGDPIENISIMHNYIHDNSGFGARRDCLTNGCNQPYGPTRITTNVLMNNQLGDFTGFPTGNTTLGGNCVDQACSYERSTGSLAVSPSSTCIPDPVTGHCSLQVQWESTCPSPGIVRTYFNETQLANTRTGTRTVQLAGPGRLDLYCGPHLLDSIFVTRAGTF